MQGVKNYNNIAAIVAATKILVTTGKLVENNGGWSSGAYSNTDRFVYYMTDPEGFTETERFAARFCKSKVLKGSWIGSIYYYLTRHGNYSTEEVERFFATLCSIESSDVPVAALLRKKILREILSGKRLSAELQWALTAKAWNFYIDGRNPKNLTYFPAKEDLPRLKVRIAPVKKEKSRSVTDEVKVDTALEAWAKKAMGSTDTLTTTQVAKGLGMTAKTLNQKLKEAGIQFFQSGQWLLRVPFSGWNLSEARTSTFMRPNGTTGTSVYTVWNERGRFFLDALHRNNFNVEQTMAYIRQ